MADTITPQPDAPIQDVSAFMASRGKPQAPAKQISSDDVHAFLAAKQDPDADKKTSLIRAVQLTAQKMNLGNTLGALSEVDNKLGQGDYSGAWDAFKALIPRPDKDLIATGHALQNGDYAEAASNIVPYLFGAEAASKGKLSGAVQEASAGAIENGVKLASEAGADAVQQVKSLTDINPAITQIAKVVIPKVLDIKSGGLFSIAKQVMTGKGKIADLLDFATDAAKQAESDKAVKSQIQDILSKPENDWLRNPENRPNVLDKIAADQGSPKPVNADISTATRIEPDFSVKSSTDALGTTQEAIPESQGVLDKLTQQRLSQVAKNGTANGLSNAEKVDLVQAVKSGDSEAVHSILDNHEGVSAFKRDVVNKVNVLVRYMKDHGIDPNAIQSAEDRQKLADAAITHAKKFTDLTGPRSGKYKGISDATMDEVRKAFQQ